MSERAVYSVSELTSRIKERLETDFPAVWVQGEISNFRIPGSGHAYFTLKDETAQLRAVHTAYHRVEVTVEERPVYGRGRPSPHKPRPVKAIRYRLTTTISPQTERIRRLEEEAAWIERYRQLWEARFQALDDVIEELKRKEKTRGRRKRP